VHWKGPLPPIDAGTQLDLMDGQGVRSVEKGRRLFIGHIGDILILIDNR
jgi:hypothetical protein